MRKNVSPFVLSLLLCAFIFDVSLAATHAAAFDDAEPQAAWQSYTFYGEEFSALLPEMPVLDHTSRIVNGNRNLFDTARNYAAYGNNIVYLIRAYDKPREREDLNYFAREYVRSLVSAGRVIQLKVQQELPRGKFSGRQYVIASDTHPTSIAQSSFYVFLTTRHAYVLRAVGADDNHPEVQRFFSSFVLSDSPGGRLVVDESKLPPPPVVYASDVALEDYKMSPDGDATAKGTAPKTNAAVGMEAGKEQSTSENSKTAAQPADSKDGQQIYKIKEVTHRAQVIYKPEPFYTEKARKNQTTGVVRLRLILSATGKVTNIVVLKFLPHGLDEKAVFAASHIKFIPAMKDDRPVSQYILIEYNFNVY
ncbi:MAG TPA: energy transducer TonB [Pyrinomonadaceae bacterium]|nr:energy transducer TonB [Pyrinomonadaceae bacterium]